MKSPLVVRAGDGGGDVSGLSLADTFTPKMVVRRYPKMSMIVDLTPSSLCGDGVLYSSTRDLPAGVAYSHLPCPSREARQLPDERTVQAFVRLCSSVLERDEEKPEAEQALIGVHCADGFTMTGLMVLAFCVEELGCSLEAAVAEFAHARAPGVYDADLLQKLAERLGEEVSLASVPPVPEWDERGAQLLGQQRGQKRQAGGPIRPPRKKKQKPDSVSPGPALSGAQPVKEPHLGRLQARVRQLVPAGFEFPTPTPITQAELATGKQWRLSWVAAGDLQLLVVLQEGVFLMDRAGNMSFLPEVRFVQRKRPDQHLDATLAFGELVLDEAPNSSARVPRFLFVDLVCMSGSKSSIAALSHQQRLQVCDVELIQPFKKRLAAAPPKKPPVLASFRVKPFFPLRDAGKVLAMKLPHAVVPGALRLASSAGGQHCVWNEADGEVSRAQLEGAGGQ